MANTDQTIRQSPGINGSEYDFTDQAETFRGFAQSQSFVCSTDEATVSRIAEDLARIRKQLKQDFATMNQTLDNMATQITDAKECIDKTREQIRKL